MIRSLCILALVACTRPSDQRALQDLDVGVATSGGAAIEVDEGLAAIRAFDDRSATLWAVAPVFSARITVDATATGDWTLVVRNVVADAVLDAGGQTILREPGTRPTEATFRVQLGAGTHALRVAPPDHDRVEPFRAIAMADIQDALPRVHEVFARINAIPDARFVVAMGDITQRAEIEEYELWERQLETLDIPFYGTIGNHELWAEPARYLDRFGRANFQFAFKGAMFTFVDSGDAGIDPIVEGWLDGWLARGRDATHVFLTHMPPVDPVGARYGSFRSTRDGRRLLSRLVEGGIDLTLYGHIHTYEAFENAGIPAYISGGGGADPMRFDGIDRHFLVLDVAPDNGIDVELHRVD